MKTIIWLEGDDAARLALAVRALIDVMRSPPPPSLLHTLYKLETKMADAERLMDDTEGK